MSSGFWEVFNKEMELEVRVGSKSQSKNCTSSSLGGHPSVRSVSGGSEMNGMGGVVPFYIQAFSLPFGKRFTYLLLEHFSSFSE